MGKYITIPELKECNYCHNIFLAKNKNFKICGKTRIITCRFPNCKNKIKITCDYETGGGRRNFLYCDYHKVYNIPKVCKLCGDKFLARNNAWNYCHGKKIKECQQCHKQFEYICKIKSSDQKFCSHECQREYLHSAYNMQEHNKRLWSNENHRIKVQTAMRNRTYTEEMRDKIRERMKLTKEKLEYYNSLIPTKTYYDRYALYNRNRFIKQIVRHEPKIAKIYIISFKNKKYIKVGICFADNRIKRWLDNGGRLKFYIIGDPLKLVEIEAHIHTYFKRIWQRDFLDGKSEFHDKKDLRIIIKYIRNKI